MHYVFRLDAGRRLRRITGEATITVKFLQDGLGDVGLDLTSRPAARA